MTEPEPSDASTEAEDAETPAGPTEEGVDADTGSDVDDDRDRTAAGDATAAGEESVVDEDLVERIGREDAASIAREIATLELEIDGLETELEAREEEVEELTSKLKRKQADFENYKKRMNQRREEEQKRATEGLVERLLDVRDNLQRALDQEEDVDIRDGVESTLRQFDDVFAAENVEPIEPEPGDDVDPHRHEVLARVESVEPADSIAGVHRPGYEMAESVLREAQVTVSDGSAADDGGTSESGEERTSESGEEGTRESGDQPSDADVADESADAS